LPRQNRAKVLTFSRKLNLNLVILTLDRDTEINITINLRRPPDTTILDRSDEQSEWIFLPIDLFLSVHKRKAAHTGCHNLAFPKSALIDRAKVGGGLRKRPCGLILQHI
jgi:hypothetical protein